jgi:hypothetical protein
MTNLDFDVLERSFLTKVAYCLATLVGKDTAKVQVEGEHLSNLLSHWLKCYSLDNLCSSPQASIKTCPPSLIRSSARVLRHSTFPSTKLLNSTLNSAL